MESKTGFSIVENIKIHYSVVGEGEPILLLHGWPTSSYLWRNIMPDLSFNNKVIAVDLPGFGKSDKPLDASYSFKFYYRIIEGFLDNLGIKKITLGVHDLGGPLGLYWAVNNFENVEKLILFNTLIYPEFSWAVRLFGLSTYLPFVKTWLTSQKGLKKAIHFGVNNSQMLTDEVIREYQAPYQDADSRKALLKTVQNLSPKGFEEISKKLPLFQGPVQVVFGEKDRILPDVKKTMQRVKNDLPQTGIVSFPNCGHFLQEEEPEEISKVLVEFMKS